MGAIMAVSPFSNLTEGKVLSLLKVDTKKLLQCPTKQILLELNYSTLKDFFTIMTKHRNIKYQNYLILMYLSCLKNANNNNKQ